MRWGLHSLIYNELSLSLVDVGSQTIYEAFTYVNLILGTVCIAVVSEI